jgi:hypothetical protein
MEAQDISSKVDDAGSKDEGLSAKVAEVVEIAGNVTTDAPGKFGGLAAAGAHRLQETARKAGHVAKEVATKALHSAQETAQKLVHRHRETADAAEHRRQERERKTDGEPKTQ